MRIFALAAMAALAAAKVVPLPSPKITPANTTPDCAQATPEITPAPTHPPLFEAYRELLKRSSNATPAFKKRSEAPCPVDCGNGFCCPLNQKCFSEKDSENQVSMQCGYPELRKRQNTDWDSIISSIYAYTNTADYSAYYSSLLSEIYALTTDPYYSSIFADPYYSSILASLTRTDYDYGTRTGGSTSQETDSGSYTYSYSPKKKKKKSPVGAIVGGVIGGLLFLALIAGIIFFVINRNKKTPSTPQAFVPQQAQAPKPEANYPLQTQTPAPAPVPEKAFYQSAQPAVPGAIEADGTQAVAPQYTGNSQQYPQQPIQQQYPQQPVQQQQYPQQPMQQQQYPQQPIQQQQYPQQQQQNFQQPGAVYHEVHNTSSPPPPPPVSPPPQQQQNFQQPGAVYHEVHNTSSPPPPPVSPPPQQQYATPIPQSGTVYHEMGTGPA